MRIPAAALLAAMTLAVTPALAATVDAVFSSASDTPVTASTYTPTGDTVNFTLTFAPAAGTDLTVVKNTGLSFINGSFDNLAHGQPVALSYNGVTYRFVANYYGGTGNDLVLVWANSRPFAWGQNRYGGLGDNTTANRFIAGPVDVTGVLAGKTIIALAGGWNYSLGLCSDGTVATWGNNDVGQIGDGSGGNYRLVPVMVNTDTGSSALYGKVVVAVAGSTYHSLALCSDGTAAAWGDNEVGELGDNQLSGLQNALPVSVNTNSGISALYGKTVTAIAVGRRHSLALCSDGTLAAWGWNEDGQVGDNTTTNRLVPVPVDAGPASALSGKTVMAVAGGYQHSLALCSDGTVVAWGYNGYGQLGNNSTNSSLVPVAVSTNFGSALYGKAVVAISAGIFHNLALCSDGTVAAWGWNISGQLGDNTTVDRHVPVAVSTNSANSILYGKTVTAIVAGAYHSVARCSDGTTAAWGDGRYGQLGNGSNPPQVRTPVAVNTSTLGEGRRFNHIYAGPIAYHTLALVAGPPASDITLAGASRLTNGSFQFGFTNTPGAFFGVLASTNPALPQGNWTSLTGLTELLPGQFQVTDPEATNAPRRFYRVRSP